MTEQKESDNHQQHERTTMFLQMQKTLQFGTALELLMF
jgi:hypothetical protein